jgi:hypothetical protein
MAERGKKGRLVDWLWLLAWGVASSVWCVTASQKLGATFDEPVYVARGLEHWRTHSYLGLLKMGTMPLAVDLQTLPLYLWERHTGVPFDPSADLGQLLPWARSGTLAFWWLLLFYGYRAGRQLAGPWGGRLAVALLAVEPTLLAHASLATTDLALTACLLALVFHYHRGRDRGWFARIVLPALWFAAAVLAKASAIVFGPLCLLAVELDRHRDDIAQVCRTLLHGGTNTAPSPCHLVTLSPRHLVKAVGLDLFPITVGGLFLVFVYCGSDWQPEPSFVAWAHQLSQDGAGRAMVWLADHLQIFSNAGEGLVRQIRHNMKGHDGTYLLGATWPRGAIWYYFPIALLIKLSLPLLVLPVLLALIRPRSLRNWACVAALLLLVFSLSCRVQIGIRLILPLVALAVVGLAGATVRAYGDLHARSSSASSLLWLRGVGLPLAVTAGLAWAVFSAVRVWPNGLCYTNEVWGGTANGYRCLSDSNYDWGQGLKELARWQRRHGLSALDVWYFGTDPALQKLPLHELPLHLLPLEGPESVLTQIQGRYLAVSTTLLYGMVSDTPGHRAAAAYLRTCRPVDRTTTFLIYDLR